MEWFLAVIWCLIGACGFVFWTTKERDFDLGDITLMLSIGWMGPFVWPIGWLLFGDDGSTIVLIKKRKSKNEK